jgi:hypothetical protein
MITGANRATVGTCSHQLSKKRIVEPCDGHPDHSLSFERIACPLPEHRSDYRSSAARPGSGKCTMRWLLYAGSLQRLWPLVTPR